MKTEQTTKTETQLLFDLDRPSLENLGYCLRHPETWPEGFKWDYSYCESCAMGLAHRLWTMKGFDPRDNRGAVSVMAREFAMPYEAANTIFHNASGEHKDAQRSVNTPTGALWWRKDHWTTEYRNDLVTPGMVADDIDAFLAKERSSGRNSSGS